MPMAFSPNPETPVERRKADLDALIHRAMNRENIPGLSVALVQDGAMVWSHGYGVANSITRRRLVAETPLEAASLGKTLTAYATLKLVEEGRLDLKRPLSSYLTKQFIDDPQYRDQISAWNVLTHTSGLSNNLMESHHAVAFVPGSRFSYSGVGFMYLQDVIEQVTRTPFNDFMTHTIFEPLGMSSSSYFRSAYEARMSRGHAYIFDFAIPMPFAPIAQPNAANLLCSTAPDLARFEAELMSPTLMSRKLVAEMLTPQMRANADVWWGLGIGLCRAGNSNCFWHWGDNLDFESYMMGCPQEKLDVVVMTNSSRGLGVAREVAAKALGR